MRTATESFPQDHPHRGRAAFSAAASCYRQLRLTLAELKLHAAAEALRPTLDQTGAAYLLHFVLVTPSNDTKRDGLLCRFHLS